MAIMQHGNKGVTATAAADAGSTAIPHDSPIGWEPSCIAKRRCMFCCTAAVCRNPEQSRITAGSMVLTGLMEVLRAYAQHDQHVDEAVRCCLELMVQLLGMGALSANCRGCCRMLERHVSSY